MAKEIYKTEPFKCWQKAKELQQKFYDDIIKTREAGGILWGGSSNGLFAPPSGLGRDVHAIMSEPYAATVAYHTDFAAKCEEAVERMGYARDLCAYMRNYWGSVLIDKFVFPDGKIISGFPKTAFLFTGHCCDSHAKWYQNVSDLKGGVPLFGVDIGMKTGQLVNDNGVDYLVEQLVASTEWMEAVTGRKYDLELEKEAIYNQLTSSSLWAECCALNQAIPAPMDEKTIFSFYVFNTLAPQSREVLDFFVELKAELEDRVARGIAAAPEERFRILTDSQPPWAFLQVFRYLQREYGIVSVGSIYSSGFALWDQDENGAIVPMKTPPEEEVMACKTIEEAMRLFATYWAKGQILSALFNSCHVKSDWMKKMVKQWHADAVMFHLNRGCEGFALGQMENRLALLEANVPVLTYEGNMGDAREFDLPRTMERIESFVEGMGLKKLQD